MRLLNQFQQEFLPPTDSPDLAADRMDLWNLNTVDAPFQNGFDEDWQHYFRECWNTQLLRRSNSLTDLIAQQITTEAEKVEYLLFRVQRWDPIRKLRLCLSRKPKMMKELVESQVSALLASLNEDCHSSSANPQTSFSVGTDRLRHMKMQGSSRHRALDVDSEDFNSRVTQEKKQNRIEIAHKCLLFCQKMSKAIDKVSEYQ